MVLNYGDNYNSYRYKMGITVKPSTNYGFWSNYYWKNYETL